jgi:flagellar biosynthesis protein FliR
MLPPAESAEVAIRAVVTGFSLALQLASPFVAIGIVWHVAMGLIGRIVSRMQIYFVSMPGQIVAGLGLLMITAGAITLAWQDGAQSFLGTLPGGN